MINYFLNKFIYCALFVNVLICSYGDWDSITSFLNSTDIFIKENNIYVATNGGLLVLDESFEDSILLGIQDGIHSLDISSMYIDSNNNLLLGSGGPVASVQLLDNNYNHINTVFLDGINGISQIVKIIEFNGNIYAIGRGNENDIFIEFRFDENGALYYQTIINSLPIQNISTIYDLDIYMENSISNLFVTTNKGVIKGEAILNEIDWSIYMDNDLTNPFFANGNIFENTFRDEIIIDVYSDPSLDEFNIMTERSLYNIVNSETIKVFESPYDTAIFSNIFRHNDFIVIGIKNMGVYSFTLNDDTVINKKMYIPETILQNKFTSLTISDDGTIIAISENGGAIIPKIDRIRNFVPYNKKNDYPVDNYLENISDFIQNSFFRGFSRNYRSGMQAPLSVISSDWNSIYFTNVGITPDLNNPYNSPLVEINLNNYECSNYGIGDDVVDGMNGIVDINSEDSNYMIVNFLNKDRDGNIWVLNPYAENYNNIIAIHDADKVWHHLKDPYGLENSSDNNSLLPTLFDFGPDGRVWISFKKYSNQNDEIVSSGGIKILDYNNTINDTLDDQWLEIVNPEVLPNGSSTDIWSLAFSKNLNENILWILTSSGVKGYIVNNLKLDPYPQFFYENIYFDEFDKLKVDSQNNLWIITRHSGVRVITQDTSLWPDAEGITTQTSSILSDIVYDVAFDDNSGKVYFATEKGISIFQSPFTKTPESDDEEILLSPNPFKLFDNELLTIWNLIPGSKVRIMTLNGYVLKTFQLNNNENKINSWNGKLENGNYISSGVYLITASHPDYKSKIGKLAVIR